MNKNKSRLKLLGVIIAIIVILLFACGVTFVQFYFQVKYMKIPADQSNDELYSRIEQLLDEKLSSK